ncbi:MAG: transglutaminase-like domain-containing protein [Terriglobales bacterium]|jgi:transglutaminase-like putative cysteine protease
MLRRSLLLAWLAFSSLPTLAQNERHFSFHYAFSVENVSPGKRPRVWIPVDHSDSFQQVRVTAKGGDPPLKPVRQASSGNEVCYAETSRADKAEYRFSVDYDVVRKEHVVLVMGKPVPAPPAARAPPVELARFLAPGRLVPVTGVPAELAGQQTKGAVTPLEKAKDIYNYVFHTMRYDKSGEGWGHGDALWACDSKHGNCTDFHSVFISMARAEKIPARFQIGFSLPAEKHSGEIAGYHCWAEFYIDSAG